MLDDLHLAASLDPAPAIAPAYLPTRRWLPTQCLACRSWQGAAVCGGCQQALVAHVARCGRCGLASTDHDRADAHPHGCNACRVEPPRVHRTIVAVDYVHPWSRIVADFKFNGHVEHARPLADLLVHAVRLQAALGSHNDTGEAPVDLVLPIPLSPARLATRGHNQAWEIARRVARALRILALADGLVRIRDSRPQNALPRRQRLENLRGAFAIGPRARGAIAGRHIALVDDVLTTGATVSAAADALLRHGAARVDAWVFARTPR